MSRPQAGCRASQATPSASATMTQTASSNTQPHPSSRIIVPPSGTLRLRAEAPSSQEQLQSEDQRRVQWADDVVNNEGMGKKSSKVCCIYHKPRPVGESSDEESSSDSSSDDESDSADDGAARPSNKANQGHSHPHAHQHDHGKSCGNGGKGTAKAKRSKRTTNAYERVPKNS